MSNTDLARQAPVEVPAFIKRDQARGTENIATSDIKPPALRLAQAMSPEVKRSEPQYIDGLREGDLFNSITQEIYGDQPVNLLIVNYLGHRNVEFDPTDRNVVIDGDIPDTDPRCQFTSMMKDGVLVKQKPRATQFKDFLILLLLDNREPQLMTLTLKSTQLKKATRLLTVLKLSKLDSFAHLIKGAPVPERKGGNSWYGWRFDPIGYPTEAQYAKAEELYAQMSGKTIALDVENVDDPEPGPRVAAVDDTDIPF